VNRQFGVKKLLRVVLGDLLCTGHVILRMRSKLICGLHNGKRYFLPITWLNLRRDKVNRQIGVRNFKNMDYFCLRLEVT